jgi:hypothetical protein
MTMTDHELIARIADRAVELYKKLGVDPPTMVYVMAEIDAVHSEIVPLRLQEFLDADDSNFAHDIGGINRHLEFYPKPHLNDCFLPRFAKV